MSPEANYPVEPADSAAIDRAGIHRIESIAAVTIHALATVAIKQDANNCRHGHRVILWDGPYS